MKRIFPALFVLLFIIAFQSCKKDSPANPDKPADTEKPDPSKIYLVSKITFHYANQSGRVEEYKYDAQNRIIQSRTENYHFTPTGSWDTFNYVYDNNNKLIKAEMISYDNRVLTTRLFVYNSNATAGDQVYEQTENGVTVLVYPVSLDANGRVKFVAKRYGIKYDSNGHFSYYGAPEGMDDFDATFQFDTKKNPFYNVVGLNPNINYLEELYPVNSLNNLLTINNSGSKVITYNVNDFPVKSIYTSATGNIETVDYEYIVK
ncbi:hypothetical protein [Mucilaginibacter sp.]|uniref:hypothetical protein n=1 Tax=Mucilaginibacter sp. TaxID=1882438 RepID=UPI0026065C6F|nr:hypothetical protein [Mucilaginibacter sp.]